MNSVDAEQLLSQIDLKAGGVRRFLIRDIKSENPSIKPDRLDKHLSGEEKEPLQLINLSTQASQAIELLKLYQEYRKEKRISPMEAKGFLGDLELFLDDEKLKA